MPEFQLEHVNIPSKDPHQLANWYAQTFGLTADKHIVRGDGVLIAFQQGEPINRPDVLHIGFKVGDMSKLNKWFEKFENVQLKTGPEFTSFQVMDPEGNCVEIYTRNSNEEAVSLSASSGLQNTSSFQKESFRNDQS